MYGAGRPPKLEDCRAKGLGGGAELFIVEGDSAALSVMAARDARTQAVLPMQGKPLNALKATEAKVAASPLFKALVDALGAGWGTTLDLSQLRYDRVLLLLDPDADGIHIGALMLMYFQRWMPALLDAGHVWMVRPPLGEVRHAATVAGAAEEVTFAYTQPQFLDLAQAARALPAGTATVLRYRGLGGLSGEALRRTCLAPATRLARVMAASDAAMASEVFGALSG